MKTQKIINIIISALVISTMLLGGVGPVPVSARAGNPPANTSQDLLVVKADSPNSPQAQPTPQVTPTPVPTTVPQVGGDNTHGKVSPAERQAAAARAAAARQAGLQSVEQMAASAAPSMNPGGTPDYFGTTPNWATSPIPASLSIIGDGTGALGTVVLSGGSVAVINISNGGSGYTDAATTASVIGGGGSGALVVPVIDPVTGAITSINVISGGSGYDTVPGIRKFVDSLPGLGPTSANDLGQYIPVAVPDITSYPGDGTLANPASDYYEIAVIQYTEQLHKDLPPTTLRGYVQLETATIKGSHIQLFYPDGSPIIDPLNSDPNHYVFAVDKPSYMGPIITAGSYDPTKIAGSAGNGKPTRIKFHNFLPAGVSGDLFIPVDPTVMGAGAGPLDAATGTVDCNPPAIPCATYTENRATLHLHGGNTPWISDGTPHQWTTPATETSKYPEGVSVYNVPDMEGGNEPQGTLTFYYTNQQSARLMFYHDHAYGITRLNVYAGEAAGYLVSDPVEQALVNGTLIPGTSITPPAGTIPADEIPLIIQDKTFVPSVSQMAVQDPTWNWGSGIEDPLTHFRTPTVVTGDLWFPHVYMPNQNPYDPMGVNAVGRWDYGPWFWPPFTSIANGMAVNPLYPSATNPLEGPNNPGTPNPSLVPEGFMDTPLINGTAYPYLNVLPKAYRFRILNASNDRMLNLQLYSAASNGSMWDPTYTTLMDANAGEVPMVPAVATAGYPANWPTDGRTGGVPNPAAAGPSFIQIGTEGGLLPAPAVIPNQPVGYLYDRRNIVVLNISTHALMLGPAERADVIVDFSQLPSTCTNLILYNDSPTPVPAFDPRLDYYTGDPDLTGMGGAPSTLPGYGPNMRTLMQIRVSGVAAPAYNLAALQTALPAAFAASQPAPLVPESAYNAAYNANYTDSYARIQDQLMTFTPAGASSPVTINFQPKAIQELFELDYGRMNATMGVEIPNTTGVNQTTIPFGYIDPATELVTTSDPMTPIGTLADGTQIWKITHNGVDTHAIHVHMFNMQLINRVGWDGMIRPPDANEVGWKETIRMNPLEDAIVALRPIVPVLPFKIGDSVRPLDVTAPLNSTMGFWGQDPAGNPVSILNQMVNYGWEYVWHCHLLGHEENDMMRPMIIGVPPDAPVNLIVASDLSVPVPHPVLTWTDNSLTAKDYTVQRATDPAFTTVTTFTVAKVAGTTQTYTDTSVLASTLYYYRVVSNDHLGGIVGVPTEPSLTVTSVPSNVVSFPSNMFYLTVVSLHGVVSRSLPGPAYASGTSVDLNVTSTDTGWTFTGWSGATCSGTGTCTVVMTADTTITANYAPVTITISGNAGVGSTLLTYTGATLADASGTVTADPITGLYSITGLTPGWSGTVTPSLAGFTFAPVNRVYAAIVVDQTLQNYVATPVTFTISGTVTLPDGVTPLAGVTLSYVVSTITKTVNTNALGVYSFTVPYYWFGLVTLSKTGYTFAPVLPVSPNYVNVIANQTAQNYIGTLSTFTISGNAGIAGAVLSYTDVTVKTATADGSGNYTLVVSYNWGGTVMPALPGYAFSPVTRSYVNVLTNLTAQNYVAIPMVPGAFGKTSPLSGVTNQPPSPVLSWGASVSAATYEYCIDTINDNACNATWVSTGSSTTVSLGALAPGTHFWQVRAVNVTGTTYADGSLTAWWSFTILPVPGNFNKSSPANGATNQPTNPTLNWGASSNAVYYQYCIDTVNDNICNTSWISTGATRSVALIGLTPGTYYWQVAAVNATGTMYANGSATAWWSFTIIPFPGAFAKIAPVTGAVNQPTSLTLSWGPSTLAASYVYCIDTINDNVCNATWISTGTATTRSLTGLLPGTTYYWQVGASNTTGITYADGSIAAWWSFTVPPIPGAFAKSTPATATGNLPSNVTLTWGASTSVVNYQYCIDTTNNNACDATWINTGTTASVALTGLTPGTKYWQVRSTNAAGTTYADGSATSWWSLTVVQAPGAFNKISPVNGIKNRPADQTLTWGASARAVSYQYCINTSAACTLPRSLDLHRHCHYRYSCRLGTRHLLLAGRSGKWCRHRRCQWSPHRLVVLHRRVHFG